jgi:hypothetical protein
MRALAAKIFLKINKNNDLTFPIVRVAPQGPACGGPQKKKDRCPNKF